MLGTGLLVEASFSVQLFYRCQFQLGPLLSVTSCILQMELLPELNQVTVVIR